MLMGAALIGLPGASAASTGRPGAAAGHVMVPVGTAPGIPRGTPLWAALTALADRQAPGHRLGLLSPSLYRAAQSDRRAFTDVVAGNNDYLAGHGRRSHTRAASAGSGTALLPGGPRLRHGHRAGPSASRVPGHRPAP
jgi:hypothetical protein